MYKSLKSKIKDFLLRKFFGIQINDVHEYQHIFTRLKTYKDLGFSPTSICDIGASNTGWTKNCLSIFPDASYFLIEPLIENQACLQTLASEFPNVSYWLGCLGAEPGKATLNVDGPDGHGSSILSGHWDNSYGVPREVTVETLDRLIEQNNLSIPDLIKIDVQGYELEVLKGATNSLQQTQAAILEVSFFPFQSNMPIFDRVVQEMSNYGFIVYDILSLSLRPLDRAAAQTDIFFLKREHPLFKDNRWASDSIY